jgi:hypothetical protein
VAEVFESITPGSNISFYKHKKLSAFEQQSKQYAYFSYIIEPVHQLIRAKFNWKNVENQEFPFNNLLAQITYEEANLSLVSINSHDYNHSCC